MNRHRVGLGRARPVTGHQHLVLEPGLSNDHPLALRVLGQELLPDELVLGRLGVGALGADRVELADRRCELHLVELGVALDPVAHALHERVDLHRKLLSLLTDHDALRVAGALLTHLQIERGVRGRLVAGDGPDRGQEHGEVDSIHDIFSE